MLNLRTESINGINSKGFPLTTSKGSSKKFVDEKWYKQIIICLAILSAFVGQTNFLDYIICTAWVLAAIFFLRTEDYWVLFIPLSMFENTIFFYFTSYSVFKILLLIGVVKLIFSSFNFGKYVNRYIILFLIFAIYAVLCLGDFLPGIISMVICVLTIFMICFSCYKLRDLEFLKRASFGLALLAISAGVYGLLHGNSMHVDVSGQEVLRFCGTSADPNIMGYKFLTGLIALIFTEMRIHKALKFILEAFLVAMILYTASTTAALSLVLLAVVCMFIQRKSVQKVVVTLIGCVVLICLLFFVEDILLFLADNNIFGGERLLEQYYSMTSGDLGSATSYRTEIWQGYMDYFFNQQGILSMLFGGNVENIYGIEKNFSGHELGAFAAHNTFIDIIMCIGIVGLVIVLAISIRNLVEDIKVYRKTKKSAYAMRIALKILTYFYSFGLSMFLSYGLMIFLI